MEHLFPCPCHSQKNYKDCCLPCHEGIASATAKELMRSRYSAYSLNLPSYIIQTTHPASPQYVEDFLI